jgi:ankyrin repeat protein
MLIEAGADVNKTDHDHFTPLMYGMLKYAFVF